MLLAVSLLLLATAAAGGGRAAAAHGHGVVYQGVSIFVVCISVYLHVHTFYDVKGVMTSVL